MSAKGTHVSEETKKKISESERGKIVSNETGKKISIAKKGTTCRRLNIPKDALEYHYLVLKETPKVIASYFGCSTRSIHYWLTLLGIPKRTRSEALCLKPKPSEETRTKMSNSHKGVDGPHYGRKASEETRKRLSESHRGYKQSEEQIKKKTGANAPSWKGGISYLPYCPKFNKKLKEEIREKFDRKCFMCSATENETLLAIHHIDYNKNSICNGKKWPLVPMCFKCHAQTNYNRWYWFNRLINYWAVNPEINFNF